MKYIRYFENNSNEEYEEIMGKILHLYSSIQLPKHIAEIIIKKILYPSYYNFGEKDGDKLKDIDLNYQQPHDKARFVQYFDSLLKSKETRGDNFEGFLAGIFNGDLSQPFSKYDVTIDNKTWSVKFVDNKYKAPEIGSFQKTIKEQGLDDYIHLAKTSEKSIGLREIFQSKNEIIKNEIWEKVISNGITGGWIIAYPEEHKEETYIVVNVIYKDVMKQILMDGLSTAPKGGYKSVNSLAISARYKNYVEGSYFYIKIPKLSLQELKDIYLSSSEEKFSQNVFGNYASKLRPDVLRYIRKNREEISKKLLLFEKFKIQ